MPFDSQFSLSLELTKVLPFGKLANFTGQKALEFVKELQRSGSDVFVEADLANVLGRHRIDHRFASGFRQAVNESTVKQLSNVIGVVLESGAGPTVRRSLQDQVYFSTVVQLSLLAWTHGLESLSEALAVALQRRSEAGSTSTPDVSNPTVLAGTLKACRDQTSNYQWDLTFAAVESMLPGILSGSYAATAVARICQLRRLDYAVLQALLDTLFAVQTLPEDRIIRINTEKGLSTIVVWAHHVLGLTVVVHSSTTEPVRFGTGCEQVILQVTPYGTDQHSSVCLLDGSGEECFRLSSLPFEDPVLESIARSSASGYGRRLLELFVSDQAMVSNFARRVLVQCMIDVDREKHFVLTDFSSVPRTVGGNDNWVNRDPALRPRRRFPRKLLREVATFLFGEIDEVDQLIASEKTKRYAEDTNGVWARGRPPPDIKTWMNDKYKPSERDGLEQFLLNLLHWLMFLIYTFASVANLNRIQNLPLNLSTKFDLFGKETRDFPAPWTCFRVLSALLVGNDSFSPDEFALVSAWGWSIYTHSLGSFDPAKVRTDTFNVVQGVPSRQGIRKEGIRDAAVSKLSIYGAEKYSVLWGPGDTATLCSTTRGSKPKVFVGLSGAYFEATEQFQCEQDGSVIAVTRLGFRAMQDLCWKAEWLPACEHVGSPTPDEDIVLPAKTWAFSGFFGPPRVVTPEWEGVHLGLVAGNRSARWLLLQSMRQHWNNSFVLLRGEDCCFACAVDLASTIRREQFRDIGITGIIL
ncbi:MAG: hypothetical protein M1833_005703 [Piccolia ochrophora]|nr:MAG: hypothetical protein M1833_005703 [Piccolia ochrophora]